MTLTIELTPEEEAALEEQAIAAGMESSEYARQLLTTELTDLSLPRNGAEILAYWEREGVRGVFADRGNAQEFARQLRDAEEAREGAVSAGAGVAIGTHTAGVGTAADAAIEEERATTQAIPVGMGITSDPTRDRGRLLKEKTT